MTREEAKKNLEELYMHLQTSPAISAREYRTAVKLAIEALSQQPREEVVLEDMPILETDNIFIPPDCKLFEKKRCPKCGLVKHFIDGHTTHYNYCSQCGSKIKWGGIND